MRGTDDDDEEEDDDDDEETQTLGAEMRKSGSTDKTKGHDSTSDPVSAEALLQSPRPAVGTVGAAAIEDYVSGVEVQAALPVSPAARSAPVPDRRYRHSLAFASLAKLDPGGPRALSEAEMTPAYGIGVGARGLLGRGEGEVRGPCRCQRRPSSQRKSAENIG